MDGILSCVSRVGCVLHFVIILPFGPFLVMTAWPTSVTVVSDSNPIDNNIVIVSDGGFRSQSH